MASSDKSSARLTYLESCIHGGGDDENNFGIEQLWSPARDTIDWRMKSYSKISDAKMEENCPTRASRWNSKRKNISSFPQSRPVRNDPSPLATDLITCCPFATFLLVFLAFLFYLSLSPLFIWILPVQSLAPREFCNFQKENYLPISTSAAKRKSK